jgi:hypothetical protein
MTIAWTRTIALGLLLGPLGCIISVDDDPNDDIDAGFAGSSSAGRAGNGGSGGTGGGSAGIGGYAGSGGSEGGVELDVTCDPEAGDEVDPCTQCLKQSCCNAWLGCNDQSCADEWLGVAECVANEEFADSDTLGVCISDSSAAMDGFVQENTQALIDCATTPSGDAGLETLCSSECFGTDIFL